MAAVALATHALIMAKRYADIGKRLELLRAVLGKSQAQLCREIEREWHALSLAHFERYIAPGLGLMLSS